ncbi:YaaA family protein [Corynebacterium kutscheri]|uniref:YaaA family protein n=1 Tax=Corynebacterium kutscheri TaxID=35755 RepID=UPI0037BE3EE8
MLIILPPSETKHRGGDGAPLNFASLSFPSLNRTRLEIAQELATLDVDEAMKILKLSEKLRGDAEANTKLFNSPTTPAIMRYTGVLYDALQANDLRHPERLAIGSALFGIVRAFDPIPYYRLSGQSKLSGVTLKSRWATQITDALAQVDELILDFRSGVYQSLGKAPKAYTIRVENKEGKIISHFNKHYKGVLARVLAHHPEQATTIDEVIEIAHNNRLNLRIVGSQLVMVID